MDPASFVPDFDAASFSGEVRVFPLPGVALFPNVVIPLHIYEGRYQELMKSALDSDGLIAMSILKAGWETDYEGRPPLESIACLGQIVSHHRLPDGRFNLMLAGVERIRLGDEIDPPISFRRCQAELLSSVEPQAGDNLAEDLSISDLHTKLSSAFKNALPDGPPPEPLQKLFEADTPLGLLADLAAHALPLSHQLKVGALAETEVRQRAEMLLKEIELLAKHSKPAGNKSSQEGYAQEGSDQEFPPPFSAN